MSWLRSRVSPDGTHHVDADGRPLYPARFVEVLPFHPPGLAPARVDGEAWHVHPDGAPAYPHRYRRTFGFYEDRAAVDTGAGWTHIRADGTPVSDRRWDWCGNVQQGRAPVRDQEGRYTHVDVRGEPVSTERWCYAGDYREGRAVVHREDGTATHVDLQGRPTHGVWWLDLDVFHKGYARARGPDGWTHVGRDGHSAHRRWFAEVEPFYNGQARCRTLDGRTVVVDEGGREVVELGPAEPPALLHALSGVLTAYWGSRTAAAVVEVGLLDALPGALPAVATRVGLNEDATARLLRATAQIGLVQPRAEDTWTPTPMGALLRRGAGMDAAAQLWVGDHWRRWEGLVPALRGGGPCGRVLGDDSFFDQLGPAARASYHRALRAYAEDDYAGLDRAVDWSGHRRVVDAGGGTGALAGMLARAHPHLVIRLLDLPGVVAAGRADLPEGVDAVGCDLFAAWPVRGDAVVLARVLHDWPDEQALRILDRAVAALDEGGVVYLLEMALPEEGSDGGLLDLNMLVTTGGRERTRAAWDRLAGDAGLRVDRVVPLRPWVAVLALVRA